jgi:hypothetical protein
MSVCCYSPSEMAAAGAGKEEAAVDLVAAEMIAPRARDC